MNLAQYLEERLSSRSVGRVTPERFSEIAQKLLASGIIWRDFSKNEREVYDDAEEVQQELREYFGAIGFVMTHDVDAQLFRLYPPGESDGVSEDEGVKRLRARLSRDFIAAAVALRFLYTEALTGKRELIDEALTIDLQELSQAMVTLLGHPLPASSADRATLMRELRKFRLVKLPTDVESLGNTETLFSVLRPVVSFISDEALRDSLAVAEAGKQRRGGITPVELAPHVVSKQSGELF